MFTIIINSFIHLCIKFIKINRSVEASILYNVSSGEFWFKQDDAKMRKGSKDIFYLKNIFTKLSDVYIKKKGNSSYRYDMHDDIVIAAIGYFIQKQVNHYQLHKMGGTNASGLLPHFAIFLPTTWDEGIREELIRPILIQNRILTENDHKGRLLFFTQLETNFRYIQSKVDKDNERMNIEIKNGKQFIMYGLKFTDDTLSVNLDLFSAHYPSTEAINDSFVGNSLNSAFFTVPLDTKIQSGIESCLKNREFDLKESNTRKILAILIKQYKKQEVVTTI